MSTTALSTYKTPNWTYYSPQNSDNYKAYASSGTSFGSGLFAPGLGENLKGTFGKIANPQFDYSFKNGGLKGWGKNLGNYYTGGKALFDAFNVASGISNNSKLADTADDLASDIVASSYNSPTIQYDLNADQLRMLRELQNGTYDSGVGFDDVDILGTLGDTAMGALSGLPGGLPGVILGAIGGGANSIVGDLGNAQSRNNSELEALYQAVLASEQQNNLAKKQRMYPQVLGY